MSVSFWLVDNSVKTGLAMCLCVYAAVSVAAVVKVMAHVVICFFAHIVICFSLSSVTWRKIIDIQLLGCVWSRWCRQLCVKCGVFSHSDRGRRCQLHRTIQNLGCETTVWWSCARLCSVSVCLLGVRIVIGLLSLPVWSFWTVDKNWWGSLTF